MTANSPDNKPDNKPAQDGGIKSKLTDAQRAMLEQKSRGGSAPGWQSTGRGHKPTQPSGKLAKSEKKVRW